MAYQWIISCTTTSAQMPTPPAQKDVENMVAQLFPQPSGVWLAGPQSVDDSDGAPTNVWVWMVTFQTASASSPAPGALTAEVTNLFGPSTANIWLAGPQSVDDGVGQESSDG